MGPDNPERQALLAGNEERLVTALKLLIKRLLLCHKQARVKCHEGSIGAMTVLAKNRIRDTELKVATTQCYLVGALVAAEITAATASVQKPFPFISIILISASSRQIAF